MNRFSQSKTIWVINLVGKNYFWKILWKLKLLLQNPGVAQIYLHQKSQEDSIVLSPSYIFLYPNASFLTHSLCLYLQYLLGFLLINMSFLMCFQNILTVTSHHHINSPYHSSSPASEYLCGWMPPTTFQGYLKTWQHNKWVL